MGPIVLLWLKALKKERVMAYILIYYLMSGVFLNICGVRHSTREQEGGPKTEEVKNALNTVLSWQPKVVGLEGNFDEIDLGDSSARFWRALKLSLERKKIKVVGLDPLSHRTCHAAVIFLRKFISHYKLNEGAGKERFFQVRRVKAMFMNELNKKPQELLQNPVVLPLVVLFGSGVFRGSVKRYLVELHVFWFLYSFLFVLVVIPFNPSLLKV